MDFNWSKPKVNNSTTDPESTQYVPRRRIEFRLMQNVFLVWLDPNIDEKSDDYQNTITNWQKVANTINIYKDPNDCIQFLNKMENEKFCLIISSSLGKDIIDRVHDMRQVDSIFTFCKNEHYHELGEENRSKIKGTYTNTKLICETLKQSTKEYEQNAAGFSVVSASTDSTIEVNLDRLDPMFMYTQIIKEILLAIKFEQKHILEFTEYCRQPIDGYSVPSLHEVNELKHNYLNKTLIWWYTLGSFNPMLNQALRLSHIDIIIKMGFFIGDLHRQIEELHQKQFSNEKSKDTFKVYRGQGVSKDEFQKISNSKGGLISFNNFLSTSTNEIVSMMFAESTLANLALVGILFTMTIDPQHSTAPFASVGEVGFYNDTEKEILFAMNTVFRIRGIEQIGADARLFQVDLELTGDNDEQLHTLTKRIREETFPNEPGWGRLAHVLYKLGKPKQAEMIYQIILQQESNDNNSALLYALLGNNQRSQAKYDEAIQSYETSLEIYEKEFLYSSDLAMLHNNIGNVYADKGEYAKALPYFEKALAIREQSLPLNQFDLGLAYNNIASLHHKMGEYGKALSFNEKALEFFEQSLPPNHPDLALCYYNIGAVYGKMDEYAKAFSFNEKALAAREQSLPPNHPDLAISYNSVATEYAKMNEYAKAFSYHEKALAIFEQSLPPNHPIFAITYNDIGLIYYRMKEFGKALSYYEKTLETFKQSLAPDHPEVATCCNNVGQLYYNTREYAKAVSYHEKALAIQEKSLPPNHLNLAISYNNIANVYNAMEEYSKALSCYEKSLAIFEQSLPPNHPHLGMAYNNIGTVYKNAGEYAKALPYIEKSLAIRKQSLPPNHPDLAISYNNVASVYAKMDEYTKALSYHEKARTIFEQSLPPIHPDLARSYNNTGLVCYKTKEFGKALSYYEKALRIFEQSLAPDHPEVATCCNNMGHVYYDIREYTKALSYHEKALTIREKSLRPNHPDLATSYNSVANVYAKMDEYDKALSYREKSTSNSRTAMSCVIF